MNALGECEKCHEDLWLVGGAPACSRCGSPQPNHPMTLARAKAPPPVAPKPVMLDPSSFIGGEGDRLKRAEAAIEAQGRRIAALEARIASLEAALRKRQAG